MKSTEYAKKVEDWLTKQADLGAGYELYSQTSPRLWELLEAGNWEEIEKIIKKEGEKCR